MTSERTAPWMIVVVAIGALSMTLSAQHLYGQEPCILCLYQRLPYVATGLLALLALKMRAGSPSIALIVTLCGLVYLGGASIAAYHVGVEQQWWISGCSGGDVSDLSFDQLKMALNSKPEKACDEIDWTLFGISMATYNVAFSLAMALFAFMAAGRIRKDHEPKKAAPLQTPAR